jgi:Bacteriophage Sf6, terminase small subunit-like
VTDGMTMVDDENTAGKQRRQGGRPTVRTQAIVDELYLRMADGESLRQICRNGAHLPSRATIHSWIKQDPKFRELMVLARRIQFEGFADDIIDISPWCSQSKHNFR